MKPLKKEPTKNVLRIHRALVNILKNHYILKFSQGFVLGVLFVASYVECSKYVT